MPRLAFIAGFALLAAAMPANASITWQIDLTNVNEIPDATPPAPTFGTATLVLNDAMTALSLDLMVFGIDATGSQTVDATDNLINAHVHAGPTVTAATNGPVVWGFIGGPFNNNAPNEGIFTPFATGVGFSYSGVWNATEGNNTTLSAQLGNILAGRSYVNVHTVRFPGGEIRGNIPPVPEPATWASFLLGFALLGLSFRRHRRTTAVVRPI